MKLKNKLIPIMTVAGLTATIAPASLTSCSSWHMTDLINGFTPTIKRAVWDGQKSDKTKMLDFYTSSCNENMDIFKQDLCWTKAGQYLYSFDAISSQGGIRVERDALKVSLENVQINKRVCQVTEGSEKKEYTYYTVNFDYVLNIVFKSYGGYIFVRNGIPSTGIGDGSHSEKLSLHLREIPFTINRDGTTARNIDPEISMFSKCFESKTLLTDWVIQVNCDYDFSSPTKSDWTINHAAFTHLQANGFDFSFKIEDDIVDVVKPTKTGNVEKYTSSFAYDFNKDSLFEKALADAKDDKTFNESLEYFMLFNIRNYYIASHYLSDIVDTTDQLWGN